VPDLVSTVKSVYAKGARGAGRGLTRLGVLPDSPPPRAQRLKHWAYSLTRAHDSLGISELDVPWWTYDAIDAVEAFITRRAGEVRAFEWGSGASTIWLARRVERVDSVEHHRGFGEMIKGRLAAGYPNAHLEIVEPVPSAHPAVGSRKEGHGGLDFSDYVARIGEVAVATGAPFDLIVVDGRAREACLAAALDHLAPGGIVVFDNTMRRRYRAAIEALPVDEVRYRGLTPTLPYPDQTSVLTRRT
jgi:hypothetical protein